MVFPQWTKSRPGKWGFTLLSVPLFWLMMSIVIGVMMTLIVWLLAMAFYIPLLLFVNGKIKLDAPTLPARTEKLRRMVVWFGRIQLGMFVYMFYFFIFVFIYMNIFLSDDLYSH
jgi:hypothetical protein